MKESRQMENIKIKRTNWEDITISNDFLFGKIMQNPQLCKELLQRILPGLEIERIEYPELQKTIKQDVDAKGVRLDVYVKDNKNVVYNIEMQTIDTKGLPKRSRYYQSMIDLQLLDKGDVSYTSLNRSYIIFTQDSFVEKLEDAVQEAKRNREWRHEYMTLLMRDRENVEKGEDKLARLIKLLSEDNRLADIVRVTDDKEYRRKLYEEYHII